MNFIRPALILGGFLVFSLLLHFPHDWQHWSADLIVSRLSPRLDRQHPDIALVYISNNSLQKYDYLSPIDRKFLSELITGIDSFNPRVIGLDVILDRHTEKSKDLLLRHTLKNAKAKIVLGVVDVGDHNTDKQSDYTNIRNERSGFSTGSLYLGEIHSSLVVSDHVVRLWDAWTEEPPLHRWKNIPDRPTFAEAVARAAGREFTPASPYIAWLLPPKSGSGILGTVYAWFCPPENRPHSLFCGSQNGPDTFLTLSAEDVLNPEDAHLALADLSDLLRGKIVLIGGNFDDRDQHLTPLSASQDSFYPGLFIQAQILAQFLAGRSMQEYGGPMTLLLAVAAGITAFLCGRHSPYPHMWLELAIAAGFVATTILAFLLADLIVPCGLLLLVGLAGAALGHYGYGKEHVERVKQL